MNDHFNSISTIKITNKKYHTVRIPINPVGKS